MILRSIKYFGLLLVFPSLATACGGECGFCPPSCAVPADPTCAVPSACTPSCAVPSGCSSCGNDCSTSCYQPQQVQPEQRCGGFMRRWCHAPLINHQSVKVEFNNREKCCSSRDNSGDPANAPAAAPSNQLVYQAVPMQMTVQAYAIQPVSYTPISYAPMSYAQPAPLAYAPAAQPAARPQSQDCDCESILSAIAELKKSIGELKNSIEGLEERTSANEEMIKKQDEISGYQTELLTKQSEKIESLKKLITPPPEPTLPPAP